MSLRALEDQPVTEPCHEAARNSFVPAPALSPAGRAPPPPPLVKTPGAVPPDHCCKPHSNDLPVYRGGADGDVPLYGAAFTRSDSPSIEAALEARTIVTIPFRAGGRSRKGYAAPGSNGVFRRFDTKKLAYAATKYNRPLVLPGGMPLTFETQKMLGKKRMEERGEAEDDIKALQVGGECARELHHASTLPSPPSHGGTTQKYAQRAPVDDEAAHDQPFQLDDRAEAPEPLIDLGELTRHVADAQWAPVDDEAAHDQPFQLDDRAEAPELVIDLGAFTRHAFDVVAEASGSYDNPEALGGPISYGMREARAVGASSPRKRELEE